MWTTAGPQDSDNGRLQKCVNEWGKERIRPAHFSGKVTVGQSECEEIWLKGKKKQLIEGWIMNFLYPFSIWVLKQPRKELSSWRWVGKEGIIGSNVAAFIILYKKRHFYRVTL